MAWSYKPLWILLINRNMKRTTMMKEAGISAAALAKMGRDQTVTMDCLGKICKTLHCGLGDIVEYVPDDEE